MEAFLQFGPSEFGDQGQIGVRRLCSHCDQVHGPGAQKDVGRFASINLITLIVPQLGRLFCVTCRPIIGIKSLLACRINALLALINHPRLWVAQNFGGWIIQGGFRFHCANLMLFGDKG